MRSLGHKVSVIFLNDTPNIIVSDGESYIKYNIKASFKTVITKMIEQSDVCYFRFELLRHKYYRKCWIYCVKKQKKYIFEIPTYPPREESIARVKASFKRHDWLGGLKTWIGSFVVVADMYLMANLSKLVCIVADNKKFMCTPTIRIENGIDVKNIPFDLNCDGKESIIRIISVSNFSVWNGYDRAIAGLQYLHDDNKKRVQLILVGDKSKAKDLVDLSINYNVQDLVVFTDSLVGESLTREYGKAVLALGALGNHRRKVFANSSLKVKEYAAYGKMMVISDAEGIEEEIKKVSYIVPSDETPIDFNEIVRWYDNISNKQKVREYIRHFAENHYSWNMQMDKILRNI